MKKNTEKDLFTFLFALIIMYCFNNFYVFKNLKEEKKILFICFVYYFWNNQKSTLYYSSRKENSKKKNYLNFKKLLSFTITT
jgi:hypothetical protein